MEQVQQPSGPQASISRLGEWCVGVIEGTGDAILLFGRNLGCLVTFRYKKAKAVEQLYQIGVLSMPIVSIALFFTGMVMAVHVAKALAKFGADLQLASIVLVSIVRELSPIFTALLISGRAGSGIAAEIGSMKITDQLKAMRALSLDIPRELLAPRIIATLIAVVLLTAIGDLAGVLGGYFVGVYRLHLLFDTYHAETVKALDMLDIYCGLFKAIFFGLMISVVGCYYGLKTRRGAGDLGRNTKSAVVTASFLVLISDYFLTELFTLLFEL